MGVVEKEYPTRFYGRTLVFWAGVLFLTPLTVLMYVIGMLFLTGIETAPNGEPDFETGTIFMIVGGLLTCLVVACIFQVYARQYPALNICREGIETRSIGVPMPSNLIMGCLFALGLWIFVLPFIALWQVVTLQAFRIRTFRWRWENIDAIPTAIGSFAIAGYLSKNHHDLEQDSQEYCSIPYNTDSFGVSIDKVMGAVQFFLHHPDARTELPSWQDEDSLYRNEALDF